MNFRDLKFTEEELANKSVTALADRPELPAAHLKARLDSGDIRERFNALIDMLAENWYAEKRLMVFEKFSVNAAIEALHYLGKDQPFFGFFLDNGAIFRGTTDDLMKMLSTKMVPVWEQWKEAKE